MKMSDREALEYAPTWGSFMTNGDPGACMYGFGDKFQVQSEAHRADCLAWMKDCRRNVEERPGDFDDDELERLDSFVAALKAAPCDASLYWYTSSDGTVEIKMTLEQAQSVGGPGSADSAVAALRTVPEIAAQLAELDADDVREELQGYGAWSDEELADHDENLNRILWQAGCDISENYEEQTPEAA